MKVAVVASSYLPNCGGLERHVHQLARGLAGRGAEVQLLTPGAWRGTERLPECESVTVRRFPAGVGPLRFGVAPALWRQLRLLAGACDLADVHTAQLPLALAVAVAGFRRLVVTLHAPLPRLMAWPYASAAARVIDAADHIVCTSSAERDLLCRAFPRATCRTEALLSGVDAFAIRAATPFPLAGTVILTVGRLDRARRVERAIAALPSLDAGFRLVIVGDGAARHRLEAYAADLRVRRRVWFAGSAADPLLNRWLHTARVVLALAPADSSGLQVMEALAAGAVVVASDIPVHREVAARVDPARVTFVSPEGSPLEVADAITDAAAVYDSAPAPALASALPGWEDVVERTWAVYRGLTAVGDVAVAAPEEAIAVARCAGIDTRLRDGCA